MFFFFFHEIDELKIVCKVSGGWGQGRIQDFLKEGAPKSRTDRTLAPVGTGVSEGDVYPLRSGEKL